jgi:hypothetical protein
VNFITASWLNPVNPELMFRIVVRIATFTFASNLSAVARSASDSSDRM